MKLGTLCYIEKENKILMLHRNKKKKDIHKGNWIGLGGKIEAGESPEECIVREVEEESGLKIVEPCLRGIMTFPLFGGEDWYVFLYTAKNFTGELITSPEGDLAWVDKEELLNLRMSQGDRIFLKWLEEDKRFFTAKFIYEGDQLVNHSIKAIPQP